MGRLSLTAGQLNYWQKRLGPGATRSQIVGARNKRLAGAAAPQAGAPGAPSGYGGQPLQPGPTPQLPFDPQLENTIATVGRNDVLTSGELDQQEGQVKQAYGFDNANDPFSKQALLRQSYERQRAGTNTSMAAAGQLYSGSLSDAQDLNRTNYEQDYNALRSEYDTALNDIAQRRIAAKGQGTDAIGQAQADALSQAAGTTPDPADAPQYAKPAAKPSAAKSYLPSGYGGWSLHEKQTYWAKRRKAR